VFHYELVQKHVYILLISAAEKLQSGVAVEQVELLVGQVSKLFENRKDPAPLFVQPKNIYVMVFPQMR
jgi:hypothetical protein